jgi:2,4-dienoyl-CoA reductase-like NADH-dependent reductase (Old Yellow Enzyme family)
MLFDKALIAILTLEDRLVMPPLETNFANEDGSVSQRTINHYARRAQGGPGLTVVGVPVVAVGRIHNPRFAEEILQQGKADLIAMGRPLFADPDLPRKAREGRYRDIRRCISCNMCMNSLSGNEPVMSDQPRPWKGR